jgi:predicted dienelactone hydrolase
MRPLEILFLALTTGAGVCLLSGRWRRIWRLLLIASLVAAIAHGALEGAHWQLIPAYAAIGILCVIAPQREELRPLLRNITATSALLLVAGGVLISFLLPMFRLPRPTGPYPVGSTTLYLKDTSRIDDAAPVAGSPRELVVQIWYPSEPSHNQFALYRDHRETHLLSSYQSLIPTNSRLNSTIASSGAPFPVILFNHAWGGRRTNYTFLTEELASHGFVVASIDDTYNAAMVAFPDGRIVEGHPAADIGTPDSSTADRVKAIWNKELIKSGADQQFVLDRLEAMNRTTGTQWFGRLNTSAAGSIGHSFGGAASTQACAEDPRIHAAVNMDGWFFAAIQARGPNQALLDINAVDPNAGLDPNTSVDTFLDETDGANVQASMRRFGGYFLTVTGATHEDFTDQPLVSPLRSLSHSGSIPARQIQSIVRAYVVAFFDKTLRGGDPAILHSQSRPFVQASLKISPGERICLRVSSSSRRH